jgi:hypothetical protein
VASPPSVTSLQQRANPELRSAHLLALTEAATKRSSAVVRSRGPFRDGSVARKLLDVLVLSLAGGGWGHSRYGYVSWSPTGIVVLLFVVFWLTGNLHFG